MLTPEELAESSRISRRLGDLLSRLRADGIPVDGVAVGRIDYSKGATSEHRQQGDSILEPFDWNADPVPQSVSPLQARKALRHSGMMPTVTAALAVADEEAREAWEYATEIRRDNPLVCGVASSVGMSPDQVDDLFRLAATL